MPSGRRRRKRRPRQKLQLLRAEKAASEEKLEGELENDLSRVNPDLLVIGRQVRTDFGGVIDLLCIDKGGCTVVIELKKGRTPRDVTAQTLDYASWVKGLSCDRFTEIAESYLSSRTEFKDPLKTAFWTKFRTELPGRLNHTLRSIIVVGVADVSKMAVDPGTERIVKYLAELGVPIAYKPIPYPDSPPENEGGLLGPYNQIGSGVGIPTRYKTIAELVSMADESGVGALYRQVKSGVKGIFSAQPYGRTVGYRAKRPVESGGGVRTVMFIRAHPGDGGGLSFTLHATRFRTILGIEPGVLRNSLPSDTRDTDVSSWVGVSKDERRHAGGGLEGEFRSFEEVTKFIKLLRVSPAAN